MGLDWAQSDPIVSARLVKSKLEFLETFRGELKLILHFKKKLKTNRRFAALRIVPALLLLLKKYILKNKSDNILFFFNLNEVIIV